MQQPLPACEAVLPTVTDIRRNTSGHQVLQCVDALKRQLLPMA
jgi:hypothetical protein